MSGEVQQAKQQADDQGTPRTMVQQYRSDFAQVLPSHVKSETFVRVAIGALKKGEKDRFQRTALERAAQNNPAALMSALLDAARLGLEPGTEQYYLTPRKNKGREEILGIVGYQGFIELMYRAGSVSSVVVEAVRTEDEFDYQPGRDDRPQHRINWDAADRGGLRLVYAYAVMKDGAISKVVVLNAARIEAIKKSAQGANSEHSPWRQYEEAMWLKSAVRQLAKWVPTSAEYLGERKQAEATRTDEAIALGPEWIEAPTEEESEVIDGEVVPDRDAADRAADLAEIEAGQASTSSGLDEELFTGNRKE